MTERRNRAAHLGQGHEDVHEVGEGGVGQVVGVEFDLIGRGMEAGLADGLGRLAQEPFQRRQVLVLHRRDGAVGELGAVAAGAAGDLQRLRRADGLHLLLAALVDGHLDHRVEDDAADVQVQAHADGVRGHQHLRRHGRELENGF